MNPDDLNIGEIYLHVPTQGRVEVDGIQSPMRGDALVNIMGSAGQVLLGAVKASDLRQLRVAKPSSKPPTPAPFKRGDIVEHVDNAPGFIMTVAADQFTSGSVEVTWPNGSRHDHQAKFLKHAAPAPKPEKPRAYVAGPMRQKPEFNFPAFDEATAYLRAMGWEVFNPAEHDRESGFDVTGLTGHEDLADQGFDLRKALAADLEYITLHADAVAVLDGWEHSSGARAEVATAHALGLPVVPWKWIGVDGYTESLHHIKPDLPPSGTINKQAWGDGALRTTLVGAPKINVEAIAAAYGMATAKCEVRTTSSTGGQKGVKPEMFSLLPVEALEKVARHYGIGAAKYDRNQWRQGYEWSKSFDALQRHAMAFWRGEDTDHETQSPHMAAVAFHALTLLTFMDEHPAHDDRYRSNP